MPFVTFYLKVAIILSFSLATYQASPEQNKTEVEWKQAVNHKPIECGKVHHRITKSRLKLNHEIFISPVGGPTHVRVIRLYCRTGYLMEVLNKKRVRGTTDTNSSRTGFELQSYGRSIVRLKNTETGRYLAINWRGKATMQGHLKEESLFRTKLERNGFHSFASHKYYHRHRHDLFIGIKKNGLFKSPLTTKPGQTAVQFMVLHYDL